MSDQLAPDTAEQTDGQKTNDLFANLRDLGNQLPPNFHPAPADLTAIVAGAVFYIATGSLEAPAVDEPDAAEARAELDEQTALNSERAKVVELERKLEARDAGPSPVVPDPVAPREPSGFEKAEQPAPIDPAEAKPTGSEPPAATDPATPTNPESGQIAPPFPSAGERSGESTVTQPGAASGPVPASGDTGVEGQQS